MPDKTKYHLYFDESGDHTYRVLDNPRQRYLGLTGIIVESEAYRTEFQPALEALKQRHFPHNPDDPVILHRDDIMYKRHVFGRLCDPAAETAFNADLLQYLQAQPFAVITVVLDKRNHLARYGSAAFHPYHYCMAALLERYCGFLRLNRSVGDVMGESRGGHEDMGLAQAYEDLLAAGTWFHSSRFFADVLTSCRLKLKPKPANIAGLQVADLLATPSKMDVLRDHGLVERAQSEFGQRLTACIATKYNRQLYQDRVAGYGKVLL